MKVSEKMKKRVAILFICILFGGIALFFFVTKKNDELNNTSTIIVKKIEDDGNINEKKITNKNDIDKIIDIIDSREEMSPEEKVPYRKMPHYKLMFLDKSDSEIIDISFFYYSDDLNWIVIDDETYYTIDFKTLLEIID